MPADRMPMPARRSPRAFDLAEIDRLLARPAPRDLADPELWARSLHRSRHRRELAAIERKHAPRRKAAALVVSGAVAASPVLPPLAAGERGSGAGSGAARAGSVVRLGSDALVELGDTGKAVAAVQSRLGVRADGVFGPITQAAVRDFQSRWGGLPVTGRVDARTWAALFDVPITFVSPRRAEASRVVTVKPATAGAAVTASASDAHRAAGAAPEASGADGAEAAAGGPRPGGTEGTAPDTAPSATAPEQTTPVADTAPDAPERATPVAGTVPTAPAPAAPVAGTAPTAPTPAAPVAGTVPTAPAPAAPVADASPRAAHMPVAGVVTGSYGESRPGHQHAGVDIAAPEGTPVSAAGSGTVTQASAEAGYGNLVCIEHGDGVSTCYAHLSRFATTPGAYVEVGDVIGYVGATGNATGPHLHFEVRRNGAPEDPTPYLRGSATLPQQQAASAATTARTLATATPAPASAPESAPAAAPTGAATPATPPAAASVAVPAESAAPAASAAVSAESAASAAVSAESAAPAASAAGSAESPAAAASGAGSPAPAESASVPAPAPSGPESSATSAVAAGTGGTAAPAPAPSAPADAAATSEPATTPAAPAPATPATTTAETPSDDPSTSPAPPPSAPAADQASPASPAPTSAPDTAQPAAA